MPGACWVEMSTVVEPHRARRPRTRSSPASCRRGAGSRATPSLRTCGEPVGQPVREPDRHRHEVVGLVARVAEHHPLVAGADLVVVVAGAGRAARSPCRRPCAMSGDCSSIEMMTPQVLPSMPNDGVGVADARRSCRGRCAGCRRSALVLISPATTTQAGGDERLARDPAVRVLGQDRVEDAVADLVGTSCRGGPRSPTPT